MQHADAVQQLIDDHAATRMFTGDHTLWAPDPTEISNRLGWLDEPERMLDRIVANARQSARDVLARSRA